MIELKNVNKYYGTHHVLKNINLSVKEAEKLVIIGPSGSGKSTTIRCMNGLEEISSGEVVVNNLVLNHKNKIEICRKYCAMVFQHFNLYPHMTVLQNLTLAPMKLQKKSKKEAEETAFKYLKVVGLLDKANVYPATLSGGQQQRVAIARSLCTKKPYILFDEPTSALDPETIQEVLDVMKEISHQSNTTMVVVTHEMGFAKEVADRIIFMEDGAIVEENIPSEFFSNPKTERARLFLGKILKN
ncbi:amino acid ABC transporter ATP-binding protein [Campylobacter jejuni]|nr:amino acid ABC transporter ATP-binding protein [Campylobacter jejuni]EHT7327119.1 amino acid ABC transporter ATP-binding protein [Campylobacter jejuni]